MATVVWDRLIEVGRRVIEQRDMLTELDRAIGDADHGVNMARGFQAVAEKGSPDEADVGATLKKAGMTLLSTVGGASGPLYGTAFMEAGKVLAGKTSVSMEDAKAALDAAIAGIQKRGKADRGEKTMLDALMPARDAFASRASSGDGIIDAVRAACDAADEGVAHTKDIAATKGRASYLGERSIGHQDPGATSTALMLRALLESLEGKGA